MARVTVEDCLEIIPNRFALAMAASHRSKQLLRGAPALVQTRNKFIVTALREIAESKVTVKERTIGWPNPEE
jgi:DNA-directed RNA polymerase subunit omega